MEKQPSPIETLQNIHQLMNQSSRFISLSGWSGISAGCFALIGAWMANNRIQAFLSNAANHGGNHLENSYRSGRGATSLVAELFMIGIVVLIFALVSSFYFTYRRVLETKLSLWNVASKRLLWNMAIPLALGGILVLQMIARGYFDLIGPSTLIFYGLALLNASKFTLGEIRYLAIGQFVVGLANLWFFPQYSLLFWALGFGVLHIIYGMIMWWNYERVSNTEQ